MHPARLVSLLFVYIGLLQFVQFAVVYRFQFTFESVLVSLVMGSVFLLTGIYRMRQPIEELRPTEYGPIVYVLVGLCLVLTAIVAVLVVS